ncbi:hypothetical protein D3C80_1300880 [compost metagenome]
MECHKLAELGDQLRDAAHKIGRGVLLMHFTINPKGDHQIVRISDLASGYHLRPK